VYGLCDGGGACFELVVVVVVVVVLVEEEDMVAGISVRLEPLLFVRRVAMIMSVVFLRLEHKRVNETKELA